MVEEFNRNVAIGSFLHYTKYNIFKPRTSLHKIEQKDRTKTLALFPDHILNDYSKWFATTYGVYIYIYIYIYIAFYWINSCRKHLCNNDNGWLKKYIPFLKKYWKEILKKMRSAIVFLTLLVCTPLKGKYIVISIQVCIYIMLNFIDYSKLCHHCVLGHTNEIKSLIICYLKCHFIWFSAKTSSQYC